VRVFSAALLSAAVVLCSCSKVETASSGGPGGQRNFWTRPGVLRIADLGEPDTLNPVVGTSQTDVDLSLFWAGYLFNYDDKGEFVPELATALPTEANGGISQDGLTFTYHLRPGVAWQDGKPFTADDVIFTWHAIMNPKNNVGSRLGYELIARIDKPDDHTAVVHLKRRWAPFSATFLTMSGTPYPVLPAHLLASLPDINRAAYNAQPVGTGPFIVDRWQRGSRIVFRANPHYWRGAPKLTRVEYDPTPSENTVVAELRSHEADMEYNGSAALYPQYQNIPGTKLILTPFNQFGIIAFNMSTPVLGDLAVRQALKYATDTEYIRVQLGHGIPIEAYSVQPEFSWAYDPGVMRFPFDLAKARQLLDAAGWKPGADGVRVKAGRRLSLVYANVAGSARGTQIGTFLQSIWRSVGVDLQFKNYPASIYLATYGEGGIVQTGKFDVATFSWVGGTDPDDATLFMCNQFPPAGQNSWRFCEKAVDEAETTALSTYDRAIRKKAYGVVQQQVAEKVPLIVSGFTQRIQVVNSDLKNYRPAHAVTTFWNTWEWEI
jgi:peptide/nickel transport system substrate-binding protein